MTGAPVPAGADCVVMLEHVEKYRSTAFGSFPRVYIDPATMLLPKARKPAAATNNFPQARNSHPHRSPSPLPADTRTSMSTFVPALPSSPPATNSFRSTPYPAPEKSATQTPPCSPPSSPTPARSLSSSPPPPTLPNHSTPPSHKPLKPTCSSSPAASPQENSTSSNLPSLASAHSFTSPASASNPANPSFTQKSPEAGDRRLAQVFGLPGNPISSAATFHLFAAPILAALAGSRGTYPRFVLAQLSRDTDRKTKPGLTRFLPALCEFTSSVTELPQVALVPWQGSGDLTAFARSNCFLVIPEDAGFLTAGSTVRILLH